MGDGNQYDDPRHPKYCEVLQIGMEAEATVFYTPEREFKVFNGYLSENRDEFSYIGGRYRKLKVVTSKASVIEIRRYYDSKEYLVLDARGENYYFERSKVRV